MKKSIFLVAIISFVSSVCFAQQPPLAAQRIAQPQVQTKTVVGKIETVTLADSTKGTNAELTVVDENGNKTNLVVASTAIIRDSATAIISLDKLAKEEKVQVEYHKTTAGANEATSIMLLK